MHNITLGVLIWCLNEAEDTLVLKFQINQLKMIIVPNIECQL